MAGGAVAGWVTGAGGSALAAGAAGGIAAGIVGDIAGQGLELALGWRCQYNVNQTLFAGALGGAGGAIGGKFSSAARRPRPRAAAVAADAGPNCFPAGTAIATQDGEKPIEEIRPGDLVLSADADTGKQSYQKVVRTFVREADELFTMHTEDGRRVEPTGEHPFWVEGKGFVAAKRLARSDLLRDVDGRSVAVAGVTSRSVKVRVYNFEVERTHTYFAGGWWVHNTCPIAFSSRGLANAAKALASGSREVTVETSDEAAELFFRQYQGAGYRNTTGMTGKQVREFFTDGKKGTYHWDLMDTKHGGRTHLQIHTFDGPVIRIFFSR